MVVAVETDLVVDVVALELHQTTFEGYDPYLGIHGKNQ
jgi:hypothetical protein